MNKREKLAGMLGLARRAGKLTVGTTATRQSILRQTISLLLLAEDLSPNTASRLSNMAQRESVPVRRFGSKQTLGSLLGRDETGVIGILDSGWARTIIELLSAAESS